MSERVPQRVLVVSERLPWREAMEIAIESAGGQSASGSGETFIARANTFKPTAIAVNVDGGPYESILNPVDWASRIAGAMRRALPSIPVVLSTELPRDELKLLARELGSSRAVLRESLVSGVVGELVLSAIEACAADMPAGKGTLATVEIVIGQATMQCDVLIDGRTHSTGPKAWTKRNQLVIVDDENSNFESSIEEFKKLDPKKVSYATRRILEALQDPLDSAHEICREHLHPNSPIHYRFILTDGDLEFVPFVVVETRNPDEYLRYVHPIARKLIPREQHFDPDSGPVTEKPRMRVLFILSNASGILRLPSYCFKNKEGLTLGLLTHLEGEISAVSSLYRISEIKQLILAPGDDNVAKIEKAFEDNAFDIVHYAGHSMRADGGGKVFLALPALPGLPVVPYDAENFARLASEGGTRLVILSSCEGSSALALSRMASRGVPAVAASPAARRWFTRI